MGIFKLGAEDRLSVDLGNAKIDMSVPFKIWLLSNSINLLLAVLFALGALVEPLSGLRICSVIALLIHGEYMGILSLNVAGVTLNTLWYMYFLIPLPAVLVSLGGYYMGLRDIKFTKFFDVKPNDNKNKK